MQSEMGWFELGRDLGIFGIASFFIQQYIAKATSKSLEKYKQELDFTIRSYQLTLDTNLERYKSELNLHLSRQTSLYERRIKIIHEMYTHLVNLQSAVNDIISVHLVFEGEDPITEEEKRNQRAREAYANYNNFFLFHKLYFDKEVSGMLKKIISEYLSATFDYFEPRRLASYEGGRPPAGEFRAAAERSKAASEKIRGEIPKILEELEEEFRKLMGVS